jgi:hypothetical protein
MRLAVLANGPFSDPAERTRPPNPFACLSVEDQRRSRFTRRVVARNVAGACLSDLSAVGWFFRHAGQRDAAKARSPRGRCHCVGRRIGFNSERGGASHVVAHLPQDDQGRSVAPHRLEIRPERERRREALPPHRLNQRAHHVHMAARRLDETKVTGIERSAREPKPTGAVFRTERTPRLRHPTAPCRPRSVCPAASTPQQRAPRNPCTSAQAVAEARSPRGRAASGRDFSSTRP